MKKILYTFIFCIFLLTSRVQAQTIKVLSVDDFSTLNPSSTYSVKTLELLQLEDGTFLYPNTIVSGVVLRVKGPKHGKRDSYFEFIPSTVAYNGQCYPIKSQKTIAQVIAYKPIDKKALAYNVARKTANLFLKGLISGIEFVQGAVEAENGQRIKSGCVKVYKDSFFSYLEVGEELNIKSGDILVLKLKKTH